MFSEINHLRSNQSVKVAVLHPYGLNVAARLEDYLFVLCQGFVYVYPYVVQVSKWGHRSDVAIREQALEFPFRCKSCSRVTKHRTDLIHVYLMVGGKYSHNVLICGLNYDHFDNVFARNE